LAAIELSGLFLDIGLLDEKGQSFAVAQVRMA
jgi:hypothetical protein